MALSTSVKYFHNLMPGASQMTESLGTMIGVLDACLVTGFGSKTATSLSVASGVATMTISAGHSFEPDVVLLVAGATPSALNGEKRVLTTSGTTLTFDANGVTDQTATGTITAKIAPLGWEKVYSGTNVAVYRSADVTSSRRYLRVDDSIGVNYADVRAFESMSDLNTGVDQFPTAAQYPLNFWIKANGTANPTAYTIIGDSKRFYFHSNSWNNASVNVLGQGGHVSFFGEINPLRLGDNYATMLSGFTDSTAYANMDSINGNCIGYMHNGSWSVSSSTVCRTYSGVLKSKQITRRAASFYTGDGQTVNANASAYFPNPTDNSMLLCSVEIWEGPIVTLRGYLPGINIPGHNLNGLIAWRDKFSGTGVLSGRKLMAVNTGSGMGSTHRYPMFFDIYGPWA